jgi:spore maturation protein CgeB
MKLVIFGLTVSSSWGNGHATLWRGLWRALARRGHSIVFFEKDVPYYAGAHRDVTELPGGELILYPDWPSVLPLAERHLADADVAMVTSFCPDGAAACDLVLNEGVPVTSFYDLDAPVTFDTLERGEPVPYLPKGGLADFDLVLSYTGGPALEALRTRLGARGLVAPLYGHVDPDAHHRVEPVAAYRCDLSYLGTYAADRQPLVEKFLVEPARRLPHRRFVIGGAQYPQDFPWTDNTFFVRHMPPPEHPAFYSSSRLTLNVTRKAMAASGWCPSGRLFEAAACACPVLSDTWPGLSEFFTPGDEILIAETTDHAVAAIDASDEELSRIGQAARQRVFDEHTSTHRAMEFEQLVERVTSCERRDERFGESHVAQRGVVTS